MPSTVQRLVRAVVTPLVRLPYRVRVVAPQGWPEGGAILVSNHVSFVDWIVLSLAAPRPPRFVAYEGYFRVPLVGAFLRLFEVLPVSSQRAHGSLRAAEAAIEAGGWVCLFPEGGISRTGQLLALRRGYELLHRRTGAPVVPLWIDGLWGSVFSFRGGRYFTKWPEGVRRTVTVMVGAPLSGADAYPARVRAALLELGADAFAARPSLEGHLADRAVRTLARAPWKRLVTDTYPRVRHLSRGMILGSSLALAARWRTTLRGERVGVVLPPSAGAFVANLALMVAGKVPVNLNFTAGPAAFGAALRKGGVTTVLTADVLRERFPDLPWPEDTRDLKREVVAVGVARGILPRVLLAWVLPSWLVARVAGVPRKGGGAEAALLFSSGSAGDPKGIPLTHANVLANLEQIAETGFLGPADRLLACLPVFHSFGFTVTVGFPLVAGTRAVTVASPLETRRIADAIASEAATVLVTTPTFLRGFLAKAERPQLASLRFVVTGAEKLPPDLRQAFEGRFGKRVMEGYGLTETSPVASVNLPDPPTPGRHSEPQVAARAGSVGRPLPGIAACVVDVATGAPVGVGTGILRLKGPNVFGGYLEDRVQTERVLAGGWFTTGDLVRIDDEGFLFIEGRLARFSKIGGEMIPQMTVEQAVAAAFGWEDAPAPKAVVVGLEDAARGERLVLLTTEPLSAEEVRARLSEAGLPNLWIPRQVVPVPEIPVLGTGKLDLQRCRKLAEGKGGGA